MVAEVIVDILTDELDRVFDYECDDTVTLGCRVLVPLAIAR
jgi:primosomal protein N'